MDPSSSSSPPLPPSLVSHLLSVSASLIPAKLSPYRCFRFCGVNLAAAVGSDFHLVQNVCLSANARLGLLEHFPGEAHSLFMRYFILARGFSVWAIRTG